MTSKNGTSRASRKYAASCDSSSKMSIGTTCKRSSCYRNRCWSMTAARDDEWIASHDVVACGDVVANFVASRVGVPGSLAGGVPSHRRNINQAVTHFFANWQAIVHCKQ